MTVARLPSRRVVESLPKARNKPGSRRLAPIPRNGVTVNHELSPTAVTEARLITVPHVFVLSRASAEQLERLAPSRCSAEPLPHTWHLNLVPPDVS